MFMTDVFELPVTEGAQSFYLIDKCTKNVRLQNYGLLNLGVLQTTFRGLFYSYIGKHNLDGLR